MVISKVLGHFKNMASPKQRLEFADTLRLNVHNTICCSRTATPAKERIRINDPSKKFPMQPTQNDFKDFMAIYVGTINSQVSNLRIIGNLLKKDYYYPLEDSRRAEQRNIIQGRVREVTADFRNRG